jgi:hypothetical protein
LGLVLRDATSKRLFAGQSNPSSVRMVSQVAKGRSTMSALSIYSPSSRLYLRNRQCISMSAAAVVASRLLPAASSTHPRPDTRPFSSSTNRMSTLATFKAPKAINEPNVCYPECLAAYMGDLGSQLEANCVTAPLCQGFRSASRPNGRA